MSEPVHHPDVNAPKMSGQFDSGSQTGGTSARRTPQSPIITTESHAPRGIAPRPFNQSEPDTAALSPMDPENPPRVPVPGLAGGAPMIIVLDKRRRFRTGHAQDDGFLLKIVFAGMVAFAILVMALFRDRWVPPPQPPPASQPSAISPER